MNIKALDVAYYWSPREAAAILDYLDRLRDLVWDLYGEEIIELRQVEDESGEEPIEEAGSDHVPDSQQPFNFDNY
ncbi:hypothetical protein [Granulosicoccus antarcticus]|uniref:Uncharacterized protein n=1 Tax=Granulosicoccus antarcticus IMCC3135 TaxID=1192854 RepID=A0A2Z2NVE9_9GAMM|nr:hypothetical protein [Granulosicoccus antarcticus]ASJ71637.1 hypothetical protein IMCC3135_07660 [Granulosicoccus antarcticus IMCC3135]ASJ73502.1 hypothetical protein IMCC3135_17100 [Granulosicoccus antarcticus IMCC3135]